MKSVGPFPDGVILHSFLGSAEMVPEFSKLGAYFSFSGFLTSIKESKAKKMLKSVPAERILLETDAPDALPKSNNFDSLFPIEGDDSLPAGFQIRGENSTSNCCSPSENQSQDARDASVQPKETLNHPANISYVLKYVSSLLEMSEEELADLSYRNATYLFSYEGSKVLLEGMKAVRKTGTEIFSRNLSMTRAKFMPPRLCPTRITFSPRGSDSMCFINGIV